jgi:hypothetical protein
MQKLKTLNLNPYFEFQQLLGSFKDVINIIMWIRDTGCYITETLEMHYYSFQVILDPNVVGIR